MDNLPPPPPYSEHDTESNSSPSSARPRPTLTPATSYVDGACTSGRPISEHDTASSTGDPTIYTPPYTPESPEESYHIGGAGERFDPVSASAYASAAAAAAAAYFESRPVQHFSTDILLIHDITVTETIQLADLPFPQPEEKWLERDVLPEDWQTFVNYLIPRHVDASNSSIADRKLKAELIDERISSLTLGHDGSLTTGFSGVAAQLEPLRRSHTDENSVSQIRSVIQTWNEGFFGPRGLLIEALEPESGEETRPMPGSWIDEPFDQASYVQNETFNERPRRGFGGRWMRADHSGFHLGKNFLSADANGFRLGKRGLVADNNGFRIGNVLVADGQGFKLGPICADSSGLRIGGGRGWLRDPHPGPHRGNHFNHHPVHMPYAHRGRPQSRHMPEAFRRRDRSRSTSSSSSSDSTASIESVGSLPDYDHLEYNQLPIAKQAVREWLDHPEQAITKESIRKIKEKIKSAKGIKKHGSNEDRKELRHEVREIFKEFKALKKSQKHALKAAKRERRSARRSARRARKAMKHEAKQWEREAKANFKREIREGKRRESYPSMPPIPTTSAFPPMRTPPGAWPPENGPFRRPSVNMTGWPFMENPYPHGIARAAELQAEARRIGAEAAAHQRSETNASVERRKEAAARVLADAQKMKVDVSRMRTEAGGMGSDDKARLKLLDVAERLEEEAENLNREGERLMAEAVQLEEDLKYEFRREAIIEQEAALAQQETALTQQEAALAQQEAALAQQESGIIHNP